MAAAGRWRKLYVREEGSFAALSGMARVIAAYLLKMCDEDGRIFMRPDEAPARAIGLRIGADISFRRLIGPAIDELLADGYLVKEPGCVRVRNFANVQRTDRESKSSVRRVGVERASSDRRVDVEIAPKCADQAENSPVEKRREEERREEKTDPARPASPAGLFLTLPEGSAQVDSRTLEICAVFAHYRTYHPRSFPKPTSKAKEWTKIRERLAGGHSVADLKAAIDGYQASPWHRGQNDASREYLQLEMMVRDDSKVAAGIELAERHRGGAPLLAPPQRKSAAEQLANVKP